MFIIKGLPIAITVLWSQVSGEFRLFPLKWNPLSDVRRHLAVGLRQAGYTRRKVREAQLFSPLLVPGSRTEPRHVPGAR